MVRFSDMLGGSGDGDEPKGTTTARDATDESEEQPDPGTPPATGTVQFVDQVGLRPSTPPAVDPPADAPDRESPQDVLDRLAQYASSARTAEPETEPDPPVAEPESPPPARAEEPTSDDLLPRGRRLLRKPGRGDKRRP